MAPSRKGHKRTLSQKPAAVKLREARANRGAGERLADKINSQRRSAVRRARAIMNTTAWSFLDTAKRTTIWATVEANIRKIYDEAVQSEEDTLSTADEVRKAVIKAFEKHAGLFVWEGEDEPLACELFNIYDDEHQE
ncbi:hypothetical protein SCAR479_05366 [Seiridium cardinale]|uniref:Uncharacterized protein n=1 Tax=Seiridium cardinale TaxID=138064 RepID=A0ABR2XWJ1_9PEZI